MRIIIHKTALLFLTLLLSQWSLAGTKEPEDKSSNIHFSQQSKIANADLRKLAKIASPENKQSDIKKALDKTTEIQTNPDFDKYSNLDLAIFYGYLGWLNTKSDDYPAAIKYYKSSLDNYSPYDQRIYNSAINQLLVLSVEANMIDQVYNDLEQEHFPSLDLHDLLTFAELYSQSMRFDLAQKLFALANEKSKSAADYDRYLYFATYIKNAALHKNQAALDMLAAQYGAENRTIKWSQLLAWRKGIENSGYPIVKVPPQYPNNAVKRRITGYAVVEYSVDTRGKTKDFTIFNEHPKGIFSKTSIDAAKKFIYKPFLGPDGSPVERHKLRNRFTYYFN